MPATHSYKTEFEWDSDGLGSYQTLGNVRAVKAPNRTRSTSDTTHLLSSDMTRELLQSWKTPGEMTVRLEYASAHYETLETIYEKEPTATTPLDGFRIKLPLLAGQSTQDIFKINGVITSLDVTEASKDSDDVRETLVTIAVSGKPTFTKAT